MSSSLMLQELWGKCITKLWVSDDQTLLRFDSYYENTVYKAFGDCCSETWFADITGIQSLLGGIVQLAEELSMNGYNVEDGRGRQEKDLAYGILITTEKGRSQIVFRNSSNGYYGGWIMALEKYPIDIHWIEITDDWMA